jgi:spermidine/putrescine transport system permease protein
LVSAANAVPISLLAAMADATATPLSLFGTNLAIIIGLVYAWLPDMVLPCYAAIERLDFSLIEAAQDLYANRFKSFVRVVLPLTMSGIVAGSILVFIPSLGAYVTPDLLGGAKSVMMGNVIYSQFMSARDYPFGSAVSFVLMAVMLVGTLIYFRAGRE